MQAIFALVDFMSGAFRRSDDADELKSGRPRSKNASRGVMSIRSSKKKMSNNMASRKKK